MLLVGEVPEGYPQTSIGNFVCLLCQRWKCASSEKKTHLWRERSEVHDTTLYGFQNHVPAVFVQSLFCRDPFADLGSELSSHLSDNCSADVCFRAERHGDLWIETDNCHILRSCCGPRSARRYRFQCITCLSKVWYPTVNRFLIRNSLTSTKPKADAKCTLCCYRRHAIFYKFLDNKGSMFSQPRHRVQWKRHVHRCSTTRSPPLYALPTRS